MTSKAYNYDELNKEHKEEVKLVDSTVVGLHHEEQHHPELLHHFAEPQQQRDAASLGMWIFLATEVMFFGGLFCAYLIYRRWYFGDFGGQQIHRRYSRCHQHGCPHLQQLDRGACSVGRTDGSSNSS